MPTTEITGIDLALGMPEVPANTFPDKRMTLIVGSCFGVPLGNDIY